jgi:hypothetical protein
MRQAALVLLDSNPDLKAMLDTAVAEKDEALRERNAAFRMHEEISAKYKESMRTCENIRLALTRAADEAAREKKESGEQVSFLLDTIKQLTASKELLVTEKLESGPPIFPLLPLPALPPWIAALSPDMQRLWWTDQDAFFKAYELFLQQRAILGGAACAAPVAAPVPPVSAAPVAAPVPPVPAAPVAVTAAPVPPVPAASVAPPVAPVRAAKCKGACVPPFVFFLTRCSCTPSSSFPWQARWGV